MPRTLSEKEIEQRRQAVRERLSKRTPGTPLSEAELQQRKEAAAASAERRRRNIAFTSGSAALGAAVGGAAYAGFVEHRRGLAERKAGNYLKMSAQRRAEAADVEAKQLEYLKALDAKAKTRIGVEKDVKSSGGSAWPVPEYRRLKRRQWAERIFNLRAAGEKPEVIEFEVGPKPNPYPDAYPPKRGYRTSVEATRQTESWNQPITESRYSALKRYLRRDNITKFRLFEQEEARAAAAGLKRGQAGWPNPKDFMSKPPKRVSRKKTVVTATSVKGKALPRSESRPRIQGKPDDETLRRLRVELYEFHNPRVERLRHDIMDLARETKSRIFRSGFAGARAALRAAPRWSVPKLAGALAAGGLIGAGVYQGVRQLSKADVSPERRLARNLAETFRGWYEDPHNADPQDLASATEPATMIFTQSAEEINRQFANKANGRPRILQGSFGQRNPMVEREAALHRARLVRDLSDSQRESIEQITIEQTRTGAPVEESARRVRDALGLTVAQAKHVDGFRLQLETLDPRVLTRALRDRRYDSVIRRALENKAPIDRERIEKMVDAYHRRYIAYRAMTIARTEALRAANLGSVASVRAQLDAMPDMTVIKTWIATKDDRTRDSHRALDGRRVMGLDTPFGDDGPRWPHDPLAPVSETANCRCTIAFTLTPGAVAASQFLAEEVRNG